MCNRSIASFNEAIDLLHIIRDEVKNFNFIADHIPSAINSNILCEVFTDPHNAISRWQSIIQPSSETTVFPQRSDHAFAVL